MKIVIGFVVVLVIWGGFALWQRIHAANVLYGAVPVPDDDPEMLAAISNATATLQSFLTEVHSPCEEQRYMLVKGRFTEGSVVEHMWVADLVVEGDTFHGVLADDPKLIKGLRYKQEVTLKSVDVTDWMIVKNGKAKGAFTTRVLRNRKTLEQRKAFDKLMPYSLDE